MARHAESAALRRLTGALVIAVPVTFTAIFVALSAVFDYPDILRAPTEEVLSRFAQGGDGLVALWYVFMLTAVGFVPIAVLLPRVLGVRGALAAMSVAVGVLAGLVQFVGLVRWPFLVPYLAETYLDPQTGAASREAVGVTFQAFNRYAGGAIGEHLGYLFTAWWTLLIAAGLAGMVGRRWLAALGAVSGLGIAVGMVEPLGLEAAGAVNAVAYAAWSLWLVIVGVVILTAKEAPAAGPPHAPSTGV